MKIGVPKEIKPQENRIGLTPESVKVLVSNGHDVMVENNGGFASVRHRLNVEGVKKFSKAVIRLKGDGKNYQFRLKNKLNDRHSYIQEFSTNGEWQEIELDLAKMHPGFRGRILDIPNWDHDIIQEITLLIGNKKNEEFSLLIDYIRLK
mgnify:CR=1 FL=1